MVHELVKVLVGTRISTHELYSRIIGVREAFYNRILELRVNDKISNVGVLLLHFIRLFLVVGRLF